MPRYEPGQREKTHDALVRIAAAALLEGGFDSVSIGKVMQAAGLTHGGFYAHFDDRAALVKAALEAALKPSVGRFEAFAAEAHASGDAADLTRKYLSDYSVGNIGGGCAAAALASEIMRQPDDVRALFIAGCEQAAQAVGSAVNGDQRPAWGAFAMMFGALALLRACPDAASRDAIRRGVAQDLRALAGRSPTAHPSE